MSFKLSIITPEGPVFDGEADSILAPGLLGVFEVLAGHAPMMTALKKGHARIKQQSKILNLSIDGGILEVDANHQVLVLADQAQAISE